MQKRVIYKTPEGGVAVVIPSPNTTLSIFEIAQNTVPEGCPFRIVDVSEIPSDRTFRDAWEFHE